ncbi:MAG: pyridoxamine 5'-phosphate oxidase family protein [Desulfobacterales bacterium]|nr:pyridoxamine 5'-phosphate oxidase family protein [Desulfobacterales bacterium]
MESDEGFRQLLRELLSSQRLAVLSTHNGGQPYASLVAFACSDDLRSLYFVTPRTTRKFSNLQNDCRMALLITSSANQETDFHEAMAVTVVGSAGEISRPGQRDGPRPLPRSDTPISRSSPVRRPARFVKVHARTYILVKNFQHVMELHLEP